VVDQLDLRNGLGADYGVIHRFCFGQYQLEAQSLKFMFPMRIDAHWKEAGLAILRLILVDESKRKDYILCAVEINMALAPAARVTLNRLRLKGQRSIHFLTESDSRKKFILSTFAEISSNATCFIARGRPDNFARDLCLKALVASLCSAENYVIIFDMDFTRLSADRQTLIIELDKSEMREKVEYRHQEPHHEYLLWLPDAIAWSYARGWPWKDQLKRFALTIHKLSD
jgi:hypothetical protein